MYLCMCIDTNQMHRHPHLQHQVLQAPQYQNQEQPFQLRHSSKWSFKKKKDLKFKISKTLASKNIMQEGQNNPEVRNRNRKL